MIKYEIGEFGTRAVIAGEWSSKLEQAIFDEGILELELNHGKGWRGTNVSFLARLPQLKSLRIVDLKISSVEPIHHLHRLKSLQLTTYCDTEIRFAEFPELEVCGLEWRPQATTVFDCKTLKNLFVNSYKGKSADDFGRLTRLESLAILNSPISCLRGLAHLKNLRELRLARLLKLISLAGIENLQELEGLKISTCRRIHTIEELRQLGRLRRLSLDNNGDIESLAPIAHLMQLESVVFAESTNIVDGDLSPLLNKPRLANVSFQNRRHYSHNRDEIIGNLKVNQ